MNNFEYVKQYYGVPAELGRMVMLRGKSGVIAEDRGHYIGINFDKDKAGHISNVHPTDEDLTYLGIGKIRKMTKSQANYRAYIRSECDCTFAEWMGFKPRIPKYMQEHNKIKSYCYIV